MGSAVPRTTASPRCSKRSCLGARFWLWCNWRLRSKTEEWKVYDLPNGSNQIPYALNVDKDGIVWVCGTNNDAIVRFDPETKEFVTFRMPTRVTFTRELEFDEEGNVWTSNANSPARHTERGLGSIIKLEILKETVKVARRAD